MSTEQLSFITDNGILNYLFAEPSAHRQSAVVTSAARTPLVVFLHGRRDHGKDLGKLLAWGLPKAVQSHAELPYYFIAPQIEEGTNWSDAQNQTLALIDNLVANLPIDPEQIVLVGFSAGAAGAWSLAADYPKRFARLVAVSGRLPETVRADQLAVLRNTPVWLFQGGKDDKLSQAETEKTVAVLRNYGFAVDYTLLPDGDHFIADAVFSDAAVHRWLAGTTQSERKVAA